jgi:hypothetical protein
LKVQSENDATGNEQNFPVVALPKQVERGIRAQGKQGHHRIAGEHEDDFGEQERDYGSWDEYTE